MSGSRAIPEEGAIVGNKSVSAALIPGRSINPSRREKGKSRESLRFPRHEAGQQKHSARINFYSGRFSRQAFDNLQVLPHKEGPAMAVSSGGASSRQVPREALALSFSPVSLPPCPGPFPWTKSEASEASERSERSEWSERSDRKGRGREAQDRILLRRTLALATGAPAIYFPGFQSPKPLISAPQRQWSASGRRRGAWRRRRRSALSRSLVYTALAARCGRERERRETRDEVSLRREKELGKKEVVHGWRTADRGDALGPTGRGWWRW